MIRERKMILHINKALWRKFAREYTDNMHRVILEGRVSEFLDAYDAWLKRKGYIKIKKEHWLNQI